MNKFFNIKSDVSLSEIGKICDVDVDNNHVIASIAPLNTATSNDLTFFNNMRYRNQLKETKALACFIADDFAHLLPKSAIPLITPTPYRTLAKALGFLYTKAFDRWDGQWENHNIFIGKDAVIGQDVHIGPNTYIGPGVEIGDHTEIGANAQIEKSIIGQHCKIAAGAVIGGESPAFDQDEFGKIHIPQCGSVRINDFVTIGPHTIIDRGSLQDTVIGAHTSIGGLVHIGHNVQIGKMATIISQTGIAGSTTIGDFTVIGGQSGIAGHLHIGKKVQIAGRSGVMHDIQDGAKIAGTPGIDAYIFARQIAILNRLAMKKEGL